MYQYTYISVNCRQDDRLPPFAQQASDALGSETMELQWKSYVANLKASGTLTSAMAVWDVSGSMCGEPMQVRGVAFASLQAFYHTTYDLLQPLCILACNSKLFSQVQQLGLSQLFSWL